MTSDQQILSHPRLILWIEAVAIISTIANPSRAALFFFLSSLGHNLRIYLTRSTLFTILLEIKESISIHMCEDKFEFEYPRHNP